MTSRICLSYIKQEQAFVVTNVHAQNNVMNIKNHRSFNIPIVLQEEEARDIVNKMMQIVISEKILYTFVITWHVEILGYNDPKKSD